MIIRDKFVPLRCSILRETRKNMSGEFECGEGQNTSHRFSSFFSSIFSRIARSVIFTITIIIAISKILQYVDQYLNLLYSFLYRDCESFYCWMLQL